MSLFEDVASRPEIEIEFVNLSGIEQARGSVRVAIARADNSFGQILGESIGPDVDQFRREVGVDRRRLRIEFE